MKKKMWFDFLAAACPDHSFHVINMPETKSFLFTSPYIGGEVGMLGVEFPPQGTVYVSIGCILPEVEAYIEQFQRVESERIIGRPCGRMRQLTFHHGPRALSGDPSDSIGLIDGVKREFDLCLGTSRLLLERHLQECSLPDWARGPGVVAVACKAIVLGHLRHVEGLADEVLRKVRELEPAYVDDVLRFQVWLKRLVKR